ncbi:MAG: hypothetical protein ACE5WD_13195 [Candidatus Aminicenantia bacterium]
MAKDLRIAAVARIISIILFYPDFILGFAKTFSDEGVFGDDVLFSLPSSLVVLSAIMTVVLIIVDILWIRGFVLIGTNLKNRLLFVSSYFLIIVVTMFNGLSLISLDFPFDLVVGAIIFFFLGIVTVFFGIGILQLQDKFGGIATAYGVLAIIEGAALVSIFLSFLALILVLPISILGAIILFRAADKL